MTTNNQPRPLDPAVDELIHESLRQINELRYQLDRVGDSPNFLARAIEQAASLDRLQHKLWGMLAAKAK